MKELYINKIHLNNFKKYVLKKEQENHLLKQKNEKKNNKIKSELLLNHSNEKKNLEEKSDININSRNILDKKINPKYNFRDYFIKLSKKNGNLTHKSSTIQQKENNGDGNLLLSSIQKKQFNINNLINISLSKLFLNNEYKNILKKRVNPYFHKKANCSINLDLRKDYMKNGAITPKNKRFLTPRYKIIKNKESKGKNIVGIRNSFFCENLSKILNDKNIEKENNKIYLFKKCKSPIDKIKKKIFHKFEEKNKSFIKDYSLYTRINNKFEKFKKLLNKQNGINDKKLSKLKLEQNMSDTNIKLGLVKLEGYEYRRNKKINNNSYNIFL